MYRLSAATRNHVICIMRHEYATDSIPQHSRSVLSVSMRLLFSFTFGTHFCHTDYTYKHSNVSSVCTKSVLRRQTQSIADGISKMHTGLNCSACQQRNVCHFATVYSSAM